jgi:hypothetical protein
MLCCDPKWDRGSKTTAKKTKYSLKPTTPACWWYPMNTPMPILKVVGGKPPPRDKAIHQIDRTPFLLVWYG